MWEAKLRGLYYGEEELAPRYEHCVNGLHLGTRLNYSMAANKLWLNKHIAHIPDLLPYCINLKSEQSID